MRKSQLLTPFPRFDRLTFDCESAAMVQVSDIVAVSLGLAQIVLAIIGIFVNISMGRRSARLRGKHNPKFRYGD